MQANECQRMLQARRENDSESLLDAVARQLVWLLKNEKLVLWAATRPAVARLATDSFAATRPLMRQNSLADKLEAACFCLFFVMP